jgi:hypothetical protein
MTIAKNPGSWKLEALEADVSKKWIETFNSPVVAQ